MRADRYVLQAEDSALEYVPAPIVEAASFRRMVHIHKTCGYLSIVNDTNEEVHVRVEYTQNVMDLVLVLRMNCLIL